MRRQLAVREEKTNSNEKLLEAAIAFESDQTKNVEIVLVDEKKKREEEERNKQEEVKRKRLEEGRRKKKLAIEKECMAGKKDKDSQAKL